MSTMAASVAELSRLAPCEFVDVAYRTILGRPPTAVERDQMLSAVMRGDRRSWLLGALRYGPEGRQRSVLISGLRVRYFAERLFHLPGIGPVLAWIDALIELPSLSRTLRSLCAIHQHRALHAEIHVELERMKQEESCLGSSLGEVRSRLESIFPPPLGDTLEVPGTPLVALARERSGIALETPIASLTPQLRYAMFESVFYESHAVAAKQRVYLRYLDHAFVHQLPFLDLGCGRGEFLQILKNDRIEAIGVDINPTSFDDLRTRGFKVVEQDLLLFLETDRETYSGASLLQVAEHLTHDQIESMLRLVFARLAPGATLIMETPNTLSPYAMGVFHTDPTHLTPLPPESLRYAVEAAGFARTRTLFQARIPQGQFAGADPRAYFVDYAIIATRP